MGAVLVLGLASVSCNGDDGGSETGDGRAARSVPPSLVEEAKEQGTVLVVVSLDARGRAEIAEAQDAVLAALGDHAQVAGRPERFPQLALRVDGEGLDILAGSPHVVAVEPNEPEPPDGS